VCKVVEEAAERQSVAVIDDAIQEGLQARSAHRSQASEEAFQWPQVHRFASMMPEPYKPSAGSGLTAQQLAIYENFGPTRTGTSHIGGQDARAQLPDFEAAAANLPTPSGDPAIPRQALQPSRGPGDMPEGRINGFSGNSLEELLQDLFDAAKAAPEDSENELQADSPVREAFARLVHTLRYTTPYAGIDRAFSMLTITIFQYLWSNRMERPLEVEVAASLLEQLSLMFPATAPVLWQELNRLDDDTLLANPKVTISLLGRRLLDRSKMDRVIANAIAQREPRAIGFFAELMDSIVDNEIPFALRTEFAGSIAALSLVALQDPSNEHARALLARLQGPGPGSAALALSASSKDQLEHIFQEWTALTQTDDNEKTSIGFVQQLYKNNILQDPETTTHFFRISVAQSTSIFEFEEERFGSLVAAYLPIDAFARLLAMLVIYQGEPEGAVKPTKGAYLDQLLCIMTVLQMQHFKERGEHSQPKIFFRLYSQLLFHFHDNMEKLGDAYDDILIVIAQFLKTLQPRFLPMFSFTWLSLVSHRYFVTPILRNGQSQMVSNAQVHVMCITLINSRLTMRMLH
jgi:CCR4-NOT transcription complex subunit 1